MEEEQTEAGKLLMQVAFAIFVFELDILQEQVPAQL